MSILDILNDRQREAAKQIEGPVLILAGAGSGKTKTITHRIAYMIKELGISPYNILAVTFTNKAAKEMKERVEFLAGEDGKRVMLSTFHSFALRLLRIFGDRLGYSSNFTIYDVDDQKKVIKDIIKSIGRKDDKNLKERDIASKISKAKEDKITPEEFESLHQYDNGKIVAEIYRRYNSVLKNNNAMDFSDILVNADKLLDLKDILSKVQEKFIYIMVDEYQDTNKIQYEIVNKIASKYRNLCVVGDENQSIYGFRGANIENILNFEKDYKDAKVVKLEENYRSTSVILDAANAVIKNNKSSKDKNLWTNRGTGEKIIIEECNDAREEAQYVAMEIIKGKATGKRYRDFTILYRTNAQSRMFEEKFLRENIPYKIFGTVSFYQRIEIKDIIGYLSVINNTDDNLNLNRILNVPKRKIGDKTFEKIENFAKDQNISIFEAIGRAHEIGDLSANLKTTLLDFYNMLKDFIILSEQMPVSELYDEIVKTIGYKDYLTSSYDDYENRIENIEELKNSIVELEKVLENMTLRDYLENVSLISATDDLDGEKDYVKLMTIHNSKGLEFPVVFLVGAEDELFPGAKAEFDPKEEEEERRLCYVAITRAEDKLYITYANSRFMYGQIDNFRSQSRFIREIPTQLVMTNKAEVKPKPAIRNSYDNSGFKKMITIDDLNKRAKDFPYSKGEKVLHKKFGMGIVKDVNDKKVTINFVDGTKEIAMAVADKFLTKA
ncbi:ATP-dependent helicase [uncultured Fusobacterium sp.]|uniref:ATP-dependent helicase n=1 Tax=uncultured Fusobacterium sp. TaxID=159267 RepID=UPI00258AA620|nr:UvrD-helicase domain-containing protein [uncultured Fusobacterium sp.]